MRRSGWVLTLVVLAGVGMGCEDTVTTASPEDLAPPLGLRSVTGDGSVYLYWEASNYGEGRQGFQIYMTTGYQSGTPEGIPAAFGDMPLGSVEDASSAGEFSATVNGLVNGQTYSFLVVAYKNDGDKISRSSNIVSDTPRRETPSEIQLHNGSGNTRYLDLSGDPVIPSTSATGADILCQSFNAGLGDRHGMVGQNGALVQDLGFVSTWDEIDAAPAGAGSYPDAAYSVQVLPGHVYAVFTGDGHYAKIWVTSVNSADFGFSCLVAYQPQTGNNNLSADVPFGN
jgi:hypothetical protein